MRRSRRCPISAWTGPISKFVRPLRLPPGRNIDGEPHRRATFATPLRLTDFRPFQMRPICSRRSRLNRCSRAAGRRPPMPRRLLGARVPTLTCWRSCCAARAIMTRGGTETSTTAGAAAGRADAEPGAAINFFGRASRVGAAGPEAGRLREAFAVKPAMRSMPTRSCRRPCTQHRARRTGLRLRQGGRAGHRGRPWDAHRELDDAGQLRARSRRFGTIRVTGKPLFSARHVGDIARFQPGDPFERSWSRICAAP